MSNQSKEGMDQHNIDQLVELASQAISITDEVILTGGDNTAATADLTEKIEELAQSLEISEARPCGLEYRRYLEA